EFMGAIAQSAETGGALRLSTAWIQPIATGEGGGALAGVASSPPMEGAGGIAGPARVRMPGRGRAYLRARDELPGGVGDPKTPYFGAVLDDDSLVPTGSARIGSIRLESWLGQQRKTQ